MALRVAQFIAVLLVGITTGLALAHVIQIPGKGALPGPAYAVVQQQVFHQYAVASTIVEIAALLATVTVLLLLPTRRLPFRLTLAGVACIVAMLLIRWLFIRPLDEVIGTWTPDAVPANWSRIRTQWAMLHTSKAAMSVLALGSTVASVLLPRLTLPTATWRGWLARPPEPRQRPRR